LAQGETQKRPALLTVLYRWKLKAGGEVVFREGWREMTESIYQARGSMGSRLHRAEDGTWLGYAQWPSEETWRKSQEAGSANEAAGRKMSRGATLLSTERLSVVDDLIKPMVYERGTPR
jgi:heme-degrading monooxygenase HmoA